MQEEPNETPEAVRIVSHDGDGETTFTIPKDMTLDKFLNNHTSEDNNSFREILAKQKEIKQQRFKRLLGLENTTAQQQAIQAGVASHPHRGIDNRPAETNMWKYKAKNTLMYHPESIEGSEVIDVDKNATREVIHDNTRANIIFDNKPKSRSEETFTMLNPYGDLMNIPVINGYPLLPPPQAEEEGVDPPLPPQAGFQIPPTPRRDILAHQLSEKAVASLRHKITSTRHSHQLRSVTPLRPGDSLISIARSTRTPNSTRTQRNGSKGQPLGAAARALLLKTQSGSTAIPFGTKRLQAHSPSLGNFAIKREKIRP